MLTRFLGFGYYYRRWLYGFVAFIVALAINIGNIQPSYGFSWLELMIRGIQIVQLSNISNVQEQELGKEINQQLISSGKVKISNNRAINSYISQIGQQLAKTSDRPDLSYTFQVVDDEIGRASCRER